MLALLLGGAYYDVREHRIPNGWIVAGFFCGMALTAVLAVLAEGGAEPAVGPAAGLAAGSAAGLAVGRYLLRILLCVAVLFPLFVLRMIGAGDIKLMGLMVGILGVGDGLRAIVYGCFAGALLGLVKLLAQRILWQRLCYLFVYFRRLFQTKEIVPYYRVERDGYGVVVPFALCLLAGYLVSLLVSLIRM